MSSPLSWRRVRRWPWKAARYTRFVLSGRANLGICPICESRTVFFDEGPSLRGGYRCWRCRSIPRWRALIKVLSEVDPDWRSMTIHECGPSGPASRKLRRECRSYTSSQYLSDVPWGETRDEVRSESVERLTFPSQSFDLVVTQDVFEHVLRPDDGFREVARVLRPGGKHVFTVPQYRGRPSLVRAVPGPDGVRHLLPPDYHRGPVDVGGSLVVTEWGDDICDFIEESSGLPTSVHREKNRRYGIDGTMSEVFVSRKP